MFNRPVLLALAAAISAGSANAASIVLWPVDPTIQPGQSATALWIENKGKDPVTLQVRSLGWSQRSGEDSYFDQDEVVASPPIATVPGGERQLVRIIRRSVGATGAEKSYRLLIDELPPPLKTGETSAPTAQLAVQMRYSIPLFTYDGNAEGAAGAAGAATKLQSRVEIINGKRFLTIGNNGSRHARLVDLRAVSGGHRTTVIPGLIGYVLAGQTMRWPLPQEATASAAFEVNVNGKDLSLSPSA